MSIPQEIHRTRLSDKVHARLLRMIREDGLKPGDRLPSERELMARYGVGRPAIREAMQTLQHAGLVDIRHGGGARVAVPSLATLVDGLGTSMHHLLSHSGSTLDHLKEARSALESEMARIAARKRDGADIAELAGILHRQDAARADAEAFLECDGRFHSRIAAISRNPIFETTVHGVFGWLRLFHTADVRKPGLEDLTLREHRAILAAIEAGDEARAARAMHDHIERANALYHQGNAT